MSTDERIRERKSLRTPLIILSTCMIVFYFVMGTWLLLDKTFFSGISSDFRQVFAVMLLVYGAYRGWRLYRDHIA